MSWARNHGQRRELRRRLPYTLVIDHTAIPSIPVRFLGMAICSTQFASETEGWRLLRYGDDRRSSSSHGYMSDVLITKETRNTLHVHITVSIGTHQMLEQLELPSSIRLYCLSTDEDVCPSNYRTIQVTNQIDPNSRVSRKSTFGKRESSTVHLKTKWVWSQNDMTESTNNGYRDWVSGYAETADPAYTEYDHNRKQL